MTVEDHSKTILMNVYFILSMVSLLCAIIVLAMKLCFASKCGKVNLCFGLVIIDRQVSLENATIDPGNIDLSTIQTKNSPNMVDLKGDHSV